MPPKRKNKKRIIQGNADDTTSRKSGTNDESESYGNEGNETPRIESLDSDRKFEEDKASMNEESKDGVYEYLD